MKVTTTFAALLVVVCSAAAATAQQPITTTNPNYNPQPLMITPSVSPCWPRATTSAWRFSRTMDAA